MRAPLTLTLLGIVLSGCLVDEDEDDLFGQSDETDNAAPTISGKPAAAIIINDRYAFTPNASDADGDELTFSIDNKPSWASFNSNNGRLVGTPTLADVGFYGNVTISVSDGTDSTDLKSFGIDVTQGGDGSVTLSWSAPSQNVDGTPLVDLRGYRIYYGTSSGDYQSQVEIDNPSVTTYVVDRLVPDTYYFVATAYNASGTESGYSGEAVRVVN